LFHHAAGLEMLRRGDTQYLMSTPSSEVRVVRFLLQTSRRQAAQGWSQHLLRLRMTRRDIGSYLGLAHETISRALTALAQEGHIRVHAHDIELVDLPALHGLQRMTRGRQREETADAPVHHLPARRADTSRPALPQEM
jgi:CRP/FNR family transcriptional regulator